MMPAHDLPRDGKRIGMKQYKCSSEALEYGVLLRRQVGGEEKMQAALQSQRIPH